MRLQSCYYYIVLYVYTGGAVEESGDYGQLLNYSLIQNVTCTGGESSLTDCTIYAPVDDCLPWCPTANIGLRCFGTDILSL